MRCKDSLESWKFVANLSLKGEVFKLSPALSHAKPKGVSGCICLMMMLITYNFSQCSVFLTIQ